jgi:hypothetical protein
MRFVVQSEVGRFALNNKILPARSDLQSLRFHASVGMLNRRTSGLSFRSPRPSRVFFLSGHGSYSSINELRIDTRKTAGPRESPVSFESA